MRMERKPQSPRVENRPRTLPYGTVDQDRHLLLPLGGKVTSMWLFRMPGSQGWLSQWYIVEQRPSLNTRGSKYRQGDPNEPPKLPQELVTPLVGSGRSDVWNCGLNELREDGDMVSKPVSVLENDSPRSRSARWISRLSILEIGVWIGPDISSDGWSDDRNFLIVVSGFAGKPKRMLPRCISRLV